uniref:Uncharacterized protein n=1 Tax=Lepeophtheirus salmonis TaxID=72036 RepID=A0A0K2TT17_LEPSM
MDLFHCFCQKGLQGLPCAIFCNSFRSSLASMIDPFFLFNVSDILTA